MERVSDINVISSQQLTAPEELRSGSPTTSEEASFIAKSRKTIHDITFGNDPRLLVVVGPCSIHDTEAGLDYARRLKKLAEAFSDELYIVMRVYFEKPRTTVGWKGLIMDPHLDGTCNLEEGLRTARSFLKEVINVGLPTATELLDPITPQYIADLISWSAIGARTTESQTHRQMASGLSMPVGFKNGTDGNVNVAINAIKAAVQSQTFLGISTDGRASAVTTAGNPDCHLILRGGTHGPNYSSEHVKDAARRIEKAGLSTSIMVDCAHANSDKDPSRQPVVLADVCQQIEAGEKAITGVMIESNIHAGNQAFPQPKESLQYGVSITDPCIDWDTTESVLRQTAATIRAGATV
ncbi:MAG: 3-deoxy-7-phosphoheptulonate synthase [Verrucomicrobiota bacterium]